MATILVGAPALSSDAPSETIGHRVLRLEVPLGATDEDLARLDELIAAAERRIPRRSRHTRAQAREALASIDSLLRERGFREEPAWLLHTALRTGAADCDSLVLLYLSIGEALGLPLTAARVRGWVPGHIVVRWRLGSRRFVDWDANNGSVLRRARESGTSPTRQDPLSIDQVLAIQHFNQGVQWAQRASLGKAIEKLDLSLRIDPAVPAVHVARADVLLRQYIEAADRSPETLERALSTLGDALRLEPKYADAYLLRGIARHYQGRFESSSRDLRRAVRIDGGNPTAHYYLGLNLLDEGRAGRAVRAFNETMRIVGVNADRYDPRLSDEARFYRGVARERGRH